MKKKRLLALAMCAVLACLLTGCGNQAGNAASGAASKMGEAVSKAGEEVSEAVSRVESFLEGDGVSGTVDSGTDGFIGDESSSFAGDLNSDREDESGLGSGSDISGVSGVVNASSDLS